MGSRRTNGIITVGALGTGSIVSTFGNINSSWLGGKFSPNTLQFDDLFDEANNMTLVDIVSETVRDIIN